MSETPHKWMDPALRGLAYWLGYKSEGHRHHLLPEHVIVEELRSLLARCQEQGSTMVLEQPFADLANGAFGKMRADVAVADRKFLVSKSKHRTVFRQGRKRGRGMLLEVKRGSVPSEPYWADLVKLNSLTEAGCDWHKYVVVAYQHIRESSLPSNWFDDVKARRITRRKQLSPDGIEYRVNRAFATYAGPRSARANWVVLLQLV